MIEISFEINGKKVDPDDIAEGIDRSLLKKLEELLEEDLGELRCPEHGVAPIILCKGDSLNTLSIELSGCCEAFLGAVEPQIYRGDDDREYRTNIQIQGEEAHNLHERLFCQKCNQERSHILQYAQIYKFSREASVLPYSFFLDVWLIWECYWCGSLILEDSYKVPEWFFGQSPWDGDYTFATFYPDTQKRGTPNVGLMDVIRSDKLSAKSFAYVPRKINRAYQEIITAFNSDFETLCTMGIRSLVEEICNDKRVASGKQLWEKIEKLATLGIPVNITENLQGVKELGNIRNVSIGLRQLFREFIVDRRPAARVAVG